MSLNNNQMLPAKVRNMKQMKEILNAEDIILTEIEKVIDEMYERASLLKEELVNETWLEQKLEKLSGGIASVHKKEDLLHVEILLNVEKKNTVMEEAVIKFLNKWLPAHLAYDVIYETFLTAETYFQCLWQHDEIFELNEVKL